MKLLFCKGRKCVLKKTSQYELLIHQSYARSVRIRVAKFINSKEMCCTYNSTHAESKQNIITVVNNYVSDVVMWWYFHKEYCIIQIYSNISKNVHQSSYANCLLNTSIWLWKYLPKLFDEILKLKVLTHSSYKN